MLTQYQVDPCKDKFIERESVVILITMKFNSILSCLMIAAVAQAIRVSMPRLNQIQDLKTTRSPLPTLKRPEERRQLSVFPKISKKFIVTPYVYRKYVTQSPIKVTKKPVMRKMVLFQDKKPVIGNEYIRKRLILKSKPLHIIPMEVKNSKHELVMSTFELHNDSFYDEDIIIQGDYSENKPVVVNPINNDNIKIDEKNTSPETFNKYGVLKIDDFTFSPKVKPTEAIKQQNVSNNEDTFTPKPIPVEVNTEHLSSNTNNTSKNEEVHGVNSEEMVDRNEFIFLDGNKKENNVSAIQDDMILTTDLNLEPKSREKRSLNVIEEEYHGTTVSGFKLTVGDRQLSSDLVFRNINS